MNTSLPCSALVLMAALAATPSQAQPVPPGEEGALAFLVRPQPGARACFKRVYDKAHLASHPHQTVTAMDFRIAYHRFEPDDNYPHGQRNYYFLMEAKRRGEKGRLVASGECTPGGSKAIYCGVECDGGGVSIEARQDGGLTVDLTGGSIRMSRGCGDEEDYVLLDAGKDDRRFRLERLAESQCPAYENW